jgi:hypothetical protein
MTRGANSVNRVGGNSITGNLFGLQVVGASVSTSIVSLGGNMVSGNGTDGAPTSTVLPI